MAAMAMAVYFNGLNARELSTWTDAMMRSGQVLDLSSLGSGRVDKHSSGGVGDKISLPLAPAVAAAGVTVPMVAGRGLGHSGGTIDKLEAIPGFQTDLSVQRFTQQLAELGCCINGQTAQIAPADKRLYALRDVTATVESIPLITASIMSKKLAEGIEGLVLDVKVGTGAFMKTVDDARRLAESMLRVGEDMGCRVVAFLTRMDEPLGRMVGNACEVVESMETLSGAGPSDIRQLVVTLGGAMVELASGCDAASGRLQIETVLDNGAAKERFERMVVAQGGDLSRLPTWSGQTVVVADSSGFVTQIDGREIGWVGVSLGAGRATKEAAIDPCVGLRVEAPVGSEVRQGEPLMTILHGASGPPPAHIVDRVRAAFTVAHRPEPARPLIVERIG